MSIRAIHSYADRSELSGDLVWAIANHLLMAVEETGMARMAVSGGKTPKLLFSMLSEIDLPWSAIHITLVDERCVPEDDEHSNLALVKELLIQGLAQDAIVEPLFNPSKTPEECASDLSAAFDPADVVILGMGADAHTASLFPNSPQLSEGLELEEPGFLVTEPTMEPFVKRLTMNRAAINAAGWKFLHIEGAGKRAVLEKARKPNANPLLSPISAFLNDSESEIEVYWAP